MSERAARYGDPKKLPPLGPEPERPDVRVLREYLEESKSSGTASTPTFAPEATSPSKGSGPLPPKP